MESKSTSETKQKLMGLVDYLEQLVLENSTLKMILTTERNASGQLRIPNWQTLLQEATLNEPLRASVADTYAPLRQGILAAVDDHALFEAVLRGFRKGKVN